MGADGRGIRAGQWAAGLEARFIEDRIAKVARLHGVTEEGVRTALLSLVDPETGQKTIERRNDDLLICIDPAAPEKARPALDLLAQGEVIRRRVDPGTGESSWLLDHDYLARAAREADRRANRWQRALAEGAKTLADAGDSWARWWCALLPPRIQLGFFYDRLRSHFRYGEHRLYAVKSLERFGPIVGILLLVAAAGAYEWQSRAEERIAKSSEDILNGLEFQEFRAAERDAEALFRLASAEEKVRQHALTLVLTNPDRTRVFIRQPDMVIRAIAGVSPRLRDLATASLAGAPAASSSNRPEITTATAKVALLLGRPEAVPLDWWLTAIKGNTDRDALGAGLRALAVKLTGSQVEEAVERVLAAIKGTTDPDALGALGSGLEALTVKLTGSHAKEAVEPFLAAIKGTTNPYALRALSAGLGALPAKLTESQATEAVEPFLAAMKGKMNPVALGALGAGLGALPIKLTGSQTKEAIEPFLAAFKGTTNPFALRVLGAGLGALSAELTESEVKEAVDPFLTTIKGTTDLNDLGVLDAGLIALTAKLTEARANEAVEPFLTAIKSTTSPAALRALAAGLGALPAKLTESQAKEVLEPFLAAIRSTTDPVALGALGEGLGALPAKLTESQAKEAVEPFLAAIRGARNPFAFRALGKGLGALAANLSEGQATEAVAAFLAAIKSTTNPVVLRALGAGLGALPAKLTGSQSKEALEPFLAAIKRTTDPVALGALGVGLGALPAKLTEGQAKEAAEPFLAAIKSAWNPIALQALGLGLGAFAAELAPLSEEAAEVAANEVLDNTRDGETFAIYAELSAKLTHGEPSDEQVRRIFHLLRHPLTAGAPTKKLMALLEKVPGVQIEFDGDLWKTVEWAAKEQRAGRLNGLDLNAPLQVP